MKTLKQNRATSFIIVAHVYILATAVGVLTYRGLTLDWWLSLLIADAVATVTTFIFSLIFQNASVYDPYWSVQPLVILVAFSIGKDLTFFGIFLIAAVSFWAIRLTANWAYTFGNLSHQDWRYTMLKEKTKGFYPIICVNLRTKFVASMVCRSSKIRKVTRRETSILMRRRASRHGTI